MQTEPNEYHKKTNSLKMKSGEIIPNQSLDLGLICNNILTACAIPSYQNSSTIVWRGYSFTLRFIIT